MRILRQMAEMIRRDGSAALVTVIGTEGSVPREAGARMAVAADGRFTGTIGGGALEFEAQRAARQLLADPARRIERFDQALGPDLGQCCGGRVWIAVECLSVDDLGWIDALLGRPPSSRAVVAEGGCGGTISRRPASPGDLDRWPAGYAAAAGGTARVVEWFRERAAPLLLFGAGHVGRALVLALAPLPFAVTWFDGRAEAFPPHIPQNVTPVATIDPARQIGSALPDAIVLVMTHSHALDLEIVSAALTARTFPFVGVIGSATKRARFVSQMRQAGLAEEQLRRLVCPIGLAGISGKEPAIIAASVAAQSLLVAEEIERLSGESSTAPERAASQRPNARL